VHTSALTISDELKAVASATGADPLAFVLGGGEDHSLLAAFPPDVELPEGWTVIGTIGEPGDEPVTVDGELYEGTTGWTHF
jgi:thiamine-monophosphate kinase